MLHIYLSFNVTCLSLFLMKHIHLSFKLHVLAQTPGLNGVSVDLTVSSHVQELAITPHVHTNVRTDTLKRLTIVVHQQHTHQQHTHQQHTHQQQNQQCIVTMIQMKNGCVSTTMSTVISLAEQTARRTSVITSHKKGGTASCMTQTAGLTSQTITQLAQNVSGDVVVRMDTAGMKNTVL